MIQGRVDAKDDTRTGVFTGRVVRDTSSDAMRHRQRQARHRRPVPAIPRRRHLPAITFDRYTLSRHNGESLAAGTITAHGVAAPVDLTLDELHVNPKELTLRASSKVDRCARQVTPGKGMAARCLTIEITASATR